MSDDEFPGPAPLGGRPPDVVERAKEIAYGEVSATGEEVAWALEVIADER